MFTKALPFAVLAFAWYMMWPGAVDSRVAGWFSNVSSSMHTETVNDVLLASGEEPLPAPPPNAIQRTFAKVRAAFDRIPSGEEIELAGGKPAISKTLVAEPAPLSALDRDRLARLKARDACYAASAARNAAATQRRTL